MTSKPRPVFTIKLRGNGGRADIHELRRVLKALLRDHALRCVSVSETLQPNRRSKVRRSDAFPGKYTKAADLGGRDHIVTIDRVVREMVGTGDKQQEKTVAYFVGNKLKPMVVNLAKWEALELIAGVDDSDHWRGLSIMLSVGKTRFQGKTVDCVTVKPVPKEKNRAPAPDPDIDELEEAEEVPF